MDEQAWVPVEVVGVRAAGEETIVLLLDGLDSLVVPIVVGRGEATAIASAQAGVVPPRPMTHDLLRNVLRALGGHLDRVEIARLEQGVFHAALVLADGVRVDSRASDAIALALRCGAPVVCSASVVGAAGIEVQVTASERDVAEFRSFLEHVSADDFDLPAGGAPDPST
ncbi:bifunctional nuclease family protein [Cellulomonas citrea]|uniref:bifunctional nuclease family protein n=1 Tax=Cellulomonas citrea TaxID=1909423 RepID=UPI0013579D21|nr:bifunctional nuclease family protein [Cellulomonas citrea]